MPNPRGPITQFSNIFSGTCVVKSFWSLTFKHNSMRLTLRINDVDSVYYFTLNYRLLIMSLVWTVVIRSMAIDYSEIILQSKVFEDLMKMESTKLWSLDLHDCKLHSKCLILFYAYIHKIRGITNSGMLDNLCIIDGDNITYNKKLIYICKKNQLIG